MAADLEKLRICMVADFINSHGGIYTQVNTITNFLRKEGTKVTIVNTKTNNILKPFMLFKLLSIARKHDLIHIHGCSYIKGFFPIIIGIITGKILKKRTIVTYHGGGAEEFLYSYKYFVRSVLKLAHKITVPSEFLHNIFKNNGIHTIIIPNIVDLENFVFKKRDKLKPKIIVTRSLHKVYNIKAAILAFNIIKKRLPEAELKLVGGGKQRKELQLLVNKLKVSGVVFKGKINNKHMPREYNTSDIFLNPTTKDNMPVSVLEAFACGLPVISTNVGGIPHIITNKQNGLLVNSNDYKTMAEKIIYLVRNQHKALELIISGRKELRKYNWNSVRTSWIRVYNTK